jgi:hypothetical protein
MTSTPALPGRRSSLDGAGIGDGRRFATRALAETAMLPSVGIDREAGGRGPLEYDRGRRFALRG